METKACNQPDHAGPHELSLSEFYLKPRSPGGRIHACSTCRRRQLNLQNLAYRETCLDRYGQACACCGVTGGLEIGHIDGNSPAQGYTGTQPRAWLVNNGSPDGLQVLCRACNRSKGGTGACRRTMAPRPGCRPRYCLPGGSRLPGTGRPDLGAGAR